MLALLYVAIFIFGIIVGSFLNVVIFRYNTGRTLGGRSGCLSCGTTLKWHELIPVVSFLLQRGKCKNCQSKFSWQYPVVEILTGALFGLVAWRFLPFISLETVIVTAFYLLVVSILVVITVYDARHKIIPDAFVFALIILSGLLLFINPTTLDFIKPNIWHVLAGPILALPFAFLWSVSKGRWMGFGDAKLAWAIGWLLGLSLGFSALVFAFWIGAIYSLLLLFFSTLLHLGKPRTIKSEVPFAPFLILGALLVMFFALDVFSIMSIFFAS